MGIKLGTLLAEALIDMCSVVPLWTTGSSKHIWRSLIIKPHKVRYNNKGLIILFCWYIFRSGENDLILHKITTNNVSHKPLHHVRDLLQAKLVFLGMLGSVGQFRLCFFSLWQCSSVVTKLEKPISKIEISPTSESRVKSRMGTIKPMFTNTSRLFHTKEWLNAEIILFDKILLETRCHKAYGTRSSLTGCLCYF